MRAFASACFLLVVLPFITHPLSAQPVCAAWQECRDQALMARERGDGEAFHDLAWRTVQTGPRNDADLLLLLARAQSASGRPHDALVMLQRLLDRGIDLTDTEASDDFRRLRALPGWPDLVERIRGMARAVEAAVADATPARAPAVPPAPVPRAASPLHALLPGVAGPAKPPAANSRSAARPEPATPPARAATLAPRTPPADVPARTSPLGEPTSGPPLPATIRAPDALAYDGVSGRLVMADGESETLKVLSELSGHADDLVSRGWGGPYRTTAMAIDATRGDLWVAASALDNSSAAAPAVLHRLQLVSGRLLDSVPAAIDRGAVRFSSLAVATGRVFVLDSAGSRLLELRAGQKVLRERARLAVEEATSLAVADQDVAYVAHARGLLRVTLADGRGTPVEANADIMLDHLRWIGHHGRSLLGVQSLPDGSHVAVRLQLDGRGRRVTARDVLGPAGSPAAAIMENVFYYVAAQPDGSTTVQRFPLR